MKITIRYTTLTSEIGPIFIGSTSQGLAFLKFGSKETVLRKLHQLCQKQKKNDFHFVPNDEINQKVKNQLKAYLAGTQTVFDVNIDFVVGTSFQQSVWQELTQIPYGETRSYKDIAVALGNRKAVRAIGGANNCNPISIVIPCHRVIGSNGALVGYGAGLEIKQFLLKLEGVMN
eukprot:gb/GECH01005498.1/.p1 GENE.gb/GECH01005498.1/~~gb/GECH01005498.1/.p1  ORF type:complete len:174 (+),score=21.73 gb/GECH01005498.1/:1-522(+)